MSNRPVYTVTFIDIAVTAAQELFSILPATQRPCEVIALRLAQITELGDTAEEHLAVTVTRGHTTAPSGGAVVTPVPLDTNAAAAGFTARRNDTTLATAGTPVNVADLTYNLRAGLLEVWPPEMRPRVANAQYLTVRLRAAPADSVTMSGTLWVREL